jgi:1,4-dihydroxy-2-naphthoate octaprenyltransferase
MILEIEKFLKHLRLPYQFLILSGPFLVGGALASTKTLPLFILEFFSVHFFLFGGVTVYNSYWDKDDGPIGGLKNPPKMTVWMLSMSWLFQSVGFLFSLFAGWLFSIVYLISCCFFWLYSSPRARWKSHPLLSIFALGIASGVASFFMGFFSMGDHVIRLSTVLMSMGVTSCLISLYPLSQVYQVEEDKKRGDITFAIKYEQKGVKFFFLTLFPVGVICSLVSLVRINTYFLCVFITGAVLMYLVIWRIIKKLTFTHTDYENVMRTKYLVGITFSLFSVLLIWASLTH